VAKAIGLLIMDYELVQSADAKAQADALIEGHGLKMWLE